MKKFCFYTILLFNFNLVAQTISGPAVMQYGLSGTFGISLPSNVDLTKPITYNWISYTCPGLVFTNNSNTSSTPTISLPITSSCCRITLICDVYYTKLDATFGTATGLKNIQMIPKLSILDMNLQPVTVVNPGIGYQLSAKFSNGAGFCMASQCSYEGYSWTILPSNVTCSGCSGTPNDLVILNVPSNINSATITAGASYNCSSQSYLLQGLSIPVKLKTPSITANSNYGCSNSPYNPSNTFLFTASPVIGASSYSWTFTSTLFAISSQNQVTTGSFIYLDVIGTGSGNVSVQAMSGGNVVNSNVLNFPVSICCIPSKSVTGNIDISNSPFFEESGTRLESTNNILSNGSATMHATKEVQLLPNFNSILGSEVHIYNDACASGFSRLAPFNESNELTANRLITISEKTEEYNSKSGIVNFNESDSFFDYNPITFKEFDKFNIESKQNEFKIVPNPNKGVLNIYFGSNNPRPINISIFNSEGKSVLIENDLKENIKEINLKEHANGLYLLKVNYQNKVETFTIIKSE